MKHMVVSTILDNRNEFAPNLQEIFTKHGCIISTRLGLHEVQGCSRQGLILLVVSGEEQEIEAFIKELQEFPRVKVNSMELAF